MGILFDESTQSYGKKGFQEEKRKKTLIGKGAI
jgi:hypothetical protein